MKCDKVNWWVVCRIKLISVINVHTTNLSFQNDEVKEHVIDIIDDIITSLNDSNSIFIDVDDGHDDVNLEDVVEPDLEATYMEDNKDEIVSSARD